MIAALTGNTIAILLVLSLVWISAREIYRSHKSGGCEGCSGCCGSCAGCSRCAHTPTDDPAAEQKGRCGSLNGVTR